MEPFGVIQPAGYRSPAWELTSTTLELLIEYGFRYDSSCMGDDRTYIERHSNLAILEFPVHWSLVDSSYFAWSLDDNGYINPIDAFTATWRSEFHSTKQEHRHLTLTMHSEIIGRGHRTAALARLIDDFRNDGGIFITHRSLADALASTDLHW